MLARVAFLTLLLTTVTAGCAVNRYVVAPYDHLSFFASRDLNPDANGRPSPIAVRVYQLTSRTTFDNLDFDAAFDNAATVLSEELISTADLVLQPGGREELTVELESEAAFIAIAAGYRHIDRASWKLVLPVNGDWYYSHDVALTANSVEAGEAARQKAPPPETMDSTNNAPAREVAGQQQTPKSHAITKLRTAPE